ncbi:hypothetical protein [Nocardiopsis composta]|uniref:Uncharacterized protein n=1 Tax=Nocardiopsis composta TaxID=157465 RepID=A0A7W8VFM8_9ACTN|nr:hypothetical protein [Nocardiopsis composta]MBB5434726.1 hypothetical protein [Nocardiopsis composta]
MTERSPDATDRGLPAAPQADGRASCAEPARQVAMPPAPSQSGSGSRRRTA